jgi:hypothetical protein
MLCDAVLALCDTVSVLRGTISVLDGAVLVLCGAVKGEVLLEGKDVLLVPMLRLLDVEVGPETCEGNRVYEASRLKLVRFICE